MLDKNKCKRYLCEACGTSHKEKWDAEDCCPPEISIVYACPAEGCDEEFNDFAELGVHFSKEHGTDTGIMSYARMLSLTDSPFLGEWEYNLYAVDPDNTNDIPLLIPDYRKMRIVHDI